MARPCVLPVWYGWWRFSWMAVYIRLAPKEKEMMREWRLLQADDYFRLKDEERFTLDNKWVPVTYRITMLQGNTVQYHAIHDKTKTHTCTLGWLIDNGHDFL
jgi:hypothetical protein